MRRYDKKNDDMQKSLILSCFQDMVLIHRMKLLMLYQAVRHVKVSALLVQELKMMNVMICLVILYVLHVQLILK